MISYFKRKSFLKELEAHSNYGKSLSTSSHNQAREVGIISRARYRIEIDKFVKRLQRQGSHVTVIYYDKTIENFDTYNKKQVKWNGVPVSDTVDSFLQKRFDRLYYIDFEMLPHQRYIYLLTQYRFSIGNADVDDAFHFSVQVKDTKDVNLLIEAIENTIDLFT